MLQENLKIQLKEAMIAKNQVAMDVIRGIMSACTNELVAKGKKPQEVLEDVEVLAVITRLAKQRKDSIEQFEKGGRQDLVLEEKSQLEILEKYLPEQMSESEVLSFVNSKMSELGLDLSKKGIVMAIMMKELKGKADGTVVKKVVDSL
jgi:uncharacterized protein